MRLWFGRDEEPPRGYLFLEGQMLKVVEYPRLFEVFGFEYGGDEESGEFKLPDPRGYFLRVFDSLGIVDPDGIERTVGDTQEGGVPAISGWWDGYTWSNVGTKGGGAVSGSATAWNCLYLGNSQYTTMFHWDVNASRNSSLYKDSLTEVRPTNMSVRLIIKATYEEASFEGLIEKLYPVGSLYTSLENTDICPIEEAGVGKWEKIAPGLFLQQVSEEQTPGEEVEAGLPNVTGQVTDVKTHSAHSQSGALYYSGEYSSNYNGGSSSKCNRINVDLSRNNSIYGKSDTVQPPALLVNIWKRVS